jgi:non-heme chloroperoxidase
MNDITTPSGTRIAFDDVGDGPPVVLTHGWVVGREMWEYAAAQMADAGLRAISVDRRGCGGSDRPSRGFDFDTLADDLAAVLQALDLRNATLVAHSVGGAEAVRLLSRHGAARVGRLVLVATTTPGAPAGRQPDAAALKELFGGLRIDRPAYVRAGVPGFFGGPDAVSPEMADWAVGLTLRASLQASVGLMEAMATTDVSADVAACPVPTLVLHGDSDTSAPLQLTGQPTAQLLPDARLEVYEGAPHGLPLTHADRIAADVLAFARAGAAP